MDKYQVTERMKMLKRMLEDPEAEIFDVPSEVYKEVLNPTFDNDGFIHKYYLTDIVKDVIEALIEKGK
ncbi:hypothetical protein [Virgibacillus litoralis]|uniref:Phage protein n=1 Tax=Virgibacillus litoralis TaxID=578221 RepID=A0ABS4HH77_9BACI|nr:hypothetical protein [Virgibacillus litoralis]MBP1950275.1 hypothetical protein [Virgibacillus litoralis]